MPNASYNWRGLGVKQVKPVVGASRLLGQALGVASRGRFPEMQAAGLATHFAHE